MHTYISLSVPYKAIDTYKQNDVSYNRNQRMLFVDDKVTCIVDYPALHPGVSVVKKIPL
jgi:hypothetical protein